jgi:capsular polysaccharide biosynthesis protein
MNQIEISQPSEIEVSPLSPEQVLRRTPPINLKPDDRRLFEHEFEQRIPATELLVMRNVFASSDGMLFKSTRILPQSFAAASLLEAWKIRSRLKFLAQNYLLKTSRRLSADALWIVDDWSGGYYHWLADTLPRLYAMRERTAELTLLLPDRFQQREFVNSSLKPFNVRNVEVIAANEKVFCPTLFVPMHTAPSGHHNENFMRGIRTLMVEEFGDRQSETAARIYVSRRKAPKRRIVNEEDVLQAVMEFGFEILDAERLSFAQQVRAFSDARYLVSNHGAGLTNMMFMSAGSNVLELRHELDRRYNCYFNLASALNLNYFYQTCAADTTQEDPHTADLHVDVQALRENLGLMLTTEK